VDNRLFVKAAALYNNTFCAAVNLQEVTQVVFFGGQHKKAIGRILRFISRS